MLLESAQVSKVKAKPVKRRRHRAENSETRKWNIRGQAKQGLPMPAAMIESPPPTRPSCGSSHGQVHRCVETNGTKTFWLLFQVTLLRATAGYSGNSIRILAKVLQMIAWAWACIIQPFSATMAQGYDRAYSTSELTAMRPATAPRERSVLRYKHTNIARDNRNVCSITETVKGLAALGPMSPVRRATARTWTFKKVFTPPPPPLSLSLSLSAYGTPAFWTVAWVWVSGSWSFGWLTVSLRVGPVSPPSSTALAGGVMSTSSCSKASFAAWSLLKEDHGQNEHRFLSLSPLYHCPSELCEHWRTEHRKRTSPWRAPRKASPVLWPLAFNFPRLEPLQNKSGLIRADPGSAYQTAMAAAGWLARVRNRVKASSNPAEEVHYSTVGCRRTGGKRSQPGSFLFFKTPANLVLIFQSVFESRRLACSAHTVRDDACRAENAA